MRSDDGALIRRTFGESAKPKQPTIIDRIEIRYLSAVAFADVFEPDVRRLLDKALHQRDASGGVVHFYRLSEIKFPTLPIKGL